MAMLSRRSGTAEDGSPFCRKPWTATTTIYADVGQMGGTMRSLVIPWPPYIGDRVGIRGSRLLGTVERIEGQGETQRFILSIFVPATANPGIAYELAQAAKAVRTMYVLDELEPHS